MIRLISYSLLCVGLAAGFFVSATEAGSDGKRSAGKILETYVEDFRLDPAAADARVFGIEVSGEKSGKWTVLVHGAKDDRDRWRVDLEESAPDKPTFIYTLDSKTLAAIDAGRLNALTAQGKALSTDITPMAVKWMPGAEKFDERPFSFHFWTRGFPEKVPFKSDATRIIHSSSIGVFYYQKGFRSAWAYLAKGQGANNGPGNPLIAPFPTMIIITEGEVKGKIEGKPVEAKAGEMIFIPPMTPHEWWNEREEPTMAILLFFGEGA